MKPLVFALPGNETFADDLSALVDGERGELTLRHFPDGETYVRVKEEVGDRRVIIVCTLHRPDDKVLPLFFLAETLRELGAAQVGLVAPYLAYMRQDRRFEPGEGVTSRYFGQMVSSHVDWLVTVDPHLHRLESLGEVYSVPTKVVHAAPVVAEWIAHNIEKPVLIGPDAESEQWVADVALHAGAPHIVLEKVRRGDRDVEVSIPDVVRWREYTPVLVDDIISTARTMIETLGHLDRADMRAAVCIGVHGVFAEGAYEELLEAGALRVVTSDTIVHPSNAITVISGIATAIGRICPGVDARIKRSLR
ncbi:MAG: ribose-phosphate pyrophosphokinase [Bradymonadaceae bacterium]